MKPLPVIFAPDALQAIKEIYAYTEANFGTKQAEYYQDQIEKTIQSLQICKKLGKRYQEVKYEIYRIKVKKHFIFYQLRDKNLLIAHVLHQSMDLPKHLN